MDRREIERVDQRQARNHRRLCPGSGHGVAHVARTLDESADVLRFAQGGDPSEESVLTLDDYPPPTNVTISTSSPPFNGVSYFSDRTSRRFSSMATFSGVSLNCATSSRSVVP